MLDILYIEFGEPRISYGSAAALTLKGYDVHIANPVFPIGEEKIKVEIEYNEKRKEVALENVYTFSRNKELADIIISIKPDIIIGGVPKGLYSSVISRRMKIPFIFWQTVVPSVYKIPIFIKYSHKYLRLITSPVGSLYNFLIAGIADYVITNDIFTESLFKKIIGNNVSTVFPTYTKFKRKNAYSNFLQEKNKHELKLKHLLDLVSYPYVLSVITLVRNSPTYNIEVLNLKNIIKYAKDIPYINFLIVGCSKKDTPISIQKAIPQNVYLVGKVYDDLTLEKIYKNALAVLCPIIIPGFSNRVMEAFFHGKVVISTSIIKKYYPELINGKNALLLDNFNQLPKYISWIYDNKTFRKTLEKNSKEYYSKYFDGKIHVENITKIFNKVLEGRS